MEWKPFEPHENEPVKRPIDLYGVRIADGNLMPVEGMVALTNLTVHELEVREDAAVRLLEEAGYPRQIRLLEEATIEGGDRIIREIFRFAPLLQLWPHIRQLRSLEESQIWLPKAVSLALVESERHSDRTCSTDDLSGADECILSPYCPRRITAKALAFDTVCDRQTINGLSLEDPADTLAMVRYQLDTAETHALLTEEQVGEFTAYFQQRVSLNR